MKIEFLQEPPLEFGGEGTHIDVRYGLMQYGPLDRGTGPAPSQLKVGIVGTKETIEGIQAWLEHCKTRIEGKESRLSNLFPAFPGFSENSCFGSTIVVNEKWCAVIHKREIEGLLSSAEADQVCEFAVDLFLQSAQSVLEKGGPVVLICAPPQDLLTMLDARSSSQQDNLDEEIDEGSETSVIKRLQRQPYFHDVLKAKAMRLGIPVQMVRPQTYSGLRLRVKPNGSMSGRSLQDEATRAWNFHTALYYKAGGVPWRMVRDSSDLSSCFVGISFYKSLEGDKLLTSVAQVFNERGEGVIVKGGQAQLDKDDKTPHLSLYDANTLLKAAIQAYRREHRTNPARVVIHKTSKMNEQEIEGFKTSSQEERIDSTDLLSVRRSFTRLFRESTYPPLRGTYLQLGTQLGLIYMRGSVDFFETYPGLYVPRPLEFLVEESDTTQLQLAKELFSLSKLNWNNTQFDGSEPITVRAARRVGDILKCVVEGETLQPAYRYFM